MKLFTKRFWRNLWRKYTGHQVVSVRNGNWNDPSTWSTRIPGQEDDVVIRHKVTLTEGTAHWGDITCKVGKK